MPNPNDFNDKQEFMSACMHQVKKVEGKNQQESVSQCLAMWGSKGKKKKCASEVVREAAYKISEL